MQSPLSGSAVALLAELRKSDLARPRTDADLAGATGLPERDIVDLAAELLAAGYLVLADGRGRWLGTPAEARGYIESLGRRAKMILIRRRAVRRAAERHTLGDRSLFDLVRDDPPEGRKWQKTVGQR